MHYMDAVKDLERVLERAKNTAIHEKATMRTRGTHSRSGFGDKTRILNQIIGGEHSEFTKFLEGKQIRKGSGQNLLLYAENFVKKRGVPMRDVKEMFDFDFIHQLLVQHGPKYDIHPLRRTVLLLKQSLGYDKRNDALFEKWNRERINTSKPSARGSFQSPASTPTDTRGFRMKRTKPPDPRTSPNLRALLAQAESDMSSSSQLLSSTYSMFTDPLTSVNYDIRSPPAIPHHNVMRLRGAGGTTSNRFLGSAPP